MIRHALLLIHALVLASVAPAIAETPSIDTLVHGLVISPASDFEAALKSLEYAETFTESHRPWVTANSRSDMIFFQSKFMRNIDRKQLDVLLKLTSGNSPELELTAPVAGKELELQLAIIRLALQKDTSILRKVGAIERLRIVLVSLYGTRSEEISFVDRHNTADQAIVGLAKEQSVFNASYFSKAIRDSERLSEKNAKHSKLLRLIMDIGIIDAGLFETAIKYSKSDLMPEFLATMTLQADSNSKHIIAGDLAPLKKALTDSIQSLDPMKSSHAVLTAMLAKTTGNGSRYNLGRASVDFIEAVLAEKWGLIVPSQMLAIHILSHANYRGPELKKHAQHIVGQLLEQIQSSKGPLKFSTVSRDASVIFRYKYETFSIREAALFATSCDDLMLNAHVPLNLFRKLMSTKALVNKAKERKFESQLPPATTIK